jgi:hypothetical protein
MVSGFIYLVWKGIWNTIVILICAGLVFIGYKANQPMAIPDAPEGMTYAEFIQDRIDATKTVNLNAVDGG